MSKGKSHRRVHSVGLNRGFTHEEYAKFLSVIDNERHRLVFEAMAKFGLRVGEVPGLRLTDVLYDQKLLRVYNIKCRRYDYMPLTGQGKTVIDAVVRLHENSSNASPALFPSLKKCGLAINSDFIRRLFRRYTMAAGLYEPYIEIPSVGNQCNGRIKTRKLCRLSCHSLRWYFITSTYEATKDIFLTMKLARHTNIEVTMGYINHYKEREFEAMNKVFEKPAEEGVTGGPEDFREFMKFYNLWRGMNGK